MYFKMQVILVMAKLSFPHHYSSLGSSVSHDPSEIILIDWFGTHCLYFSFSKWI